jgi:hypothetical protein
MAYQDIPIVRNVVARFKSTGDRPSSSESRSLVEAYGNYLSSVDKAPVPTQQRLYRVYMAKLERLEGKYPGMNFRSEETLRSLEQAARKYLSTKIQGPGSTW